ncbi:MAG TPA: ATP-binding protein [Ignavibacteriaceae bacterium]|nr:ATP-binding protein [Ignavibacteriaceae bacterium]
MEKNILQNAPVDMLPGSYNDFEDRFTWLLTFEEDTEEINYSGNVALVTGYNPVELRGMRGKWNNLVNEEDLGQVRKTFNELLNGISVNSCTIDYRIVNKNNGIVWLRESVRAERLPSGKIKSAFGIVQDISDLKNSESRLLEEIRRLQDANYSRDDFIAILSHDLRSPFTSILGFSEILLNEPLPESEKNEYLNLIHSSSVKQLKLINNLLDWSRLRTGRSNIEPAKVDVRNAIYNSVSALTGEAVRKNVEIRVYVPASQYIEADETLFCKVILNLLENSIKYSGENKSIDIKTSAFNDKFIEFIVRDKGKGIPETNKHKLFQINKIFSTQGTHGEKGTGLGLILCREIIEKHGGDIWYFSESDEGSEFHFTFPLFRENILIVGLDDNTSADVKNIIEEVKPSFSIRECPNGFEAIDEIKSKIPSLVILKNKMQLMDGVQFIEILQSENRTAGIPVYLITDDSKETADSRHNNFGVTKIFDRSALSSTLKSEIMSI